MERKLGLVPAVLLGVFSVVSLTLAAGGLFVIASEEGWTGKTIALESAMESAQGVRVGTRVRVLGIPVGQVTAVAAPASPEDPVIVRFWISDRHRELVRGDATVRVVKDGVVGERILEIDPGTSGAEVIADGDRLVSAPSADWETLIVGVDALVTDVRSGEGTLGRLLADDEAYRSLQEVAGNASRVLAKVDAIVEALRNGQGTAGRLLADDEAYESLRELTHSARKVLAKVNGVVDDLESGKGTAGKLLADDEAYRSMEKLVEHAEQVLGTVDENYASVKQNWLMKRWLKDRYELLVRPDATKYRKVFAEEGLFERGRAILTGTGKATLDEAAAWIHEFNDREAEILVTGFAVDERDGRLAELTTRSQAQAVLDYLVNQHGIHKTGWISRRTVSAHGFGNLPDPNGAADLPGRRIEILAFVK